MTAFEQFRRNINTLIDDKKTSRGDIARSSGLSASLVRGYVLGENEPSLGQAERIAAALGVSLSSLLGNEVPVLPAKVRTPDEDRLAAIRAILAANDKTVPVLLDIINKRGLLDNPNKTSDLA